MIVVANAGPLIALAQIGHLHILPALYGEIHIPPAVRKEVLGYGRGTRPEQNRDSRHTASGQATRALTGGNSLAGLATCSGISPEP